MLAAMITRSNMLINLHIGSVSGTVSTEAGAQKGFNVLTIDIHYVVQGKIKESWHVEDWLS